MDTTKKSHVRTVSMIAGVTAVGGFLFGFDNGSTAGTIGFLQEHFDLSAAGIGFLASSLILGAMIGLLFAGKLSDRVGRKNVLLLCAVLFVVGAAGEAIAPNEATLIVARMLLGFGIGVETMIAPLYISEVAPPERRGRLVSYNQLFNVTGNLVVFALSATVANLSTELFNITYTWRIIFGVGVIPAVVFLILLRHVPESPRWLAEKGRREEAFEVLKRVNADEEQATIELREIEQDLRREMAGGIRELLRPTMRRTLIIGVGVGVLQQITGINIVFYYGPELFKDAGLGSNAALANGVFIGVTFVIATLVSMTLIDKIGRRTLMIIGSVAMALLHAGIGTLFLMEAPNAALLIVLIVAFAAFFALTFGTATYVVIAEIFPTHLRALAAGICTFCLWTSTYLVAQFFPVLIESIGNSATFYMFAVICAAGCVFILSLVPETKGKTLEELSAELHRDPAQRV